MNCKFTFCLLAFVSLVACQATTTTTKRETLREQNARYASTQSATGAANEPAPPAEGPEDVSADLDPVHNPALLPSPLLRQNAAGGP